MRATPNRKAATDPGFLAALHRGAAYGDAARFANAAGALNVRKLGGVEGVLPYGETLAWMERQPTAA